MHGIEKCLKQDGGGRVTPDSVRCIQGVTRPDEGETWGLQQRMGDKVLDLIHTHRILTKSSDNVSSSIYIYIH